MQVVLQNRDSCLYFRSPDEWVSDVKQATDFGTTQRALEFGHQLKQACLDVVLIFADRRHDIRLPVSI
jgi:hypothetical protein